MRSQCYCIAEPFNPAGFKYPGSFAAYIPQTQHRAASTPGYQYQMAAALCASCRPLANHVHQPSGPRKASSAARGGLLALPARHLVGDCAQLDTFGASRVLAPATRHRLTLAAATPEPAPWYEDSHRGGAVLTLTREREVAASAPPPLALLPLLPASNEMQGSGRHLKDDPNHGYTWLTHPCPGNPFRTRVDEDAWYVEPTLEQRQLAMALDIPLYGIC